MLIISNDCYLLLFSYQEKYKLKTSRMNVRRLTVKEYVKKQSWGKLQNNLSIIYYNE